LDDDGQSEVLFSGNRTDTETLGGSMDASQGVAFQVNGLDFSLIEPDQSGFLLNQKDHRSIVKMMSDSTIKVFVSNNDDHLSVFTKPLGRTSIELQEDDVFATILRSNGTEVKREFYFGEGHLSQNSRKLIVPKDARKITIKNSSGKVRLSIEYPH